MTGELVPDAGNVAISKGTKVGYLAQDPVFDAENTVIDEAELAFAKLHELSHRLRDLEHEMAEHQGEDLEKTLQKYQDVQHEFDIEGGYAWRHKLEATLQGIGLEKEIWEQNVATLSGGQRSRLALAKLLIAEPDLLLLDEPTNHLDIDSIRWLEEFLREWKGALLFITHDRAFLRRLATRIIELDRGRLQSGSGNYDEWLRQKAAALHAEEKQNALFDKRLAQEEVWIRRGIEARRTRDQGRVQRLLAMREQYAQRRNLPGEARLVLQEADRSGRLVADLEHVSLARGDRPIIRNLSTTILRGDKVGIIGPNGAGKTTLLNILLGRLAPDSGKVKLGTKQEIAYFDQLRAQLNDDQPVFEAIGNGREYVEINGARKHVMTYLQEFLFTPDRARSPVRALSGGERSRLLLARLFSVPSNIVVLDEPTNDLDAETLDLLEELLIDYSGTVLLVSHDREFLDNVATRCLVFEGYGHVGDYVGGYKDWLRQTGQSRRLATAPVGTASAATVAPKGAPAKDKPAAGAVPGRDRLSHKEQRELAELPGRIEALESEQAKLSNQLSDPALYTGEKDKARALQDRASAIERELGEAYRRWEALEQPR
jgi:ATP-binding cassette subfamily F protein uup